MRMEGLAKERSVLRYHERSEDVRLGWERGQVNPGDVQDIVGRIARRAERKGVVSGHFESGIKDSRPVVEEQRLCQHAGDGGGGGQ